MAARRKAGRRRRSPRGAPAWLWLVGGIFIGLCTAVFLMFKGYLPELKQHLPPVSSEPAEPGGAALVEEEKKQEKPEKPRYDFFTVLPEMEVVVPEQELKRQASPASAPAAGSGQEQYILQVGSFRNAADAEQMKARLALLGTMASVQTVTVDSQTWHRVRIGPFEGARAADEMRRMLAENRIDTLVMKANP